MIYDINLHQSIIPEDCILPLLFPNNLCFDYLEAGYPWYKPNSAKWQGSYGYSSNACSWRNP